MHRTSSTSPVLEKSHGTYQLQQILLIDSVLSLTPPQEVCLPMLSELVISRLAQNFLHLGPIMSPPQTKSELTETYPKNTSGNQDLCDNLFATTLRSLGEQFSSLIGIHEAKVDSATLSTPQAQTRSVSPRNSKAPYSGQEPTLSTQLRTLPRTQISLRTGWPGLNLVSASLNLPISPRKWSKQADFSPHIPATPRHSSPPVTPRSSDLTRAASRCRSSNLHMGRRRMRSVRDRQRELRRPMLHKSRQHGSCHVRHRLSGVCQHVYKRITRNVPESSYFPPTNRRSSQATAAARQVWNFGQTRDARQPSISRKSFACSKGKSYRTLQNALRCEAQDSRRRYTLKYDLVGLVESTLTARQYQHPAHSEMITLRRASDPCTHLRTKKSSTQQAFNLDSRGLNDYIISAEGISLVKDLIQEFIASPRSTVLSTPPRVDPSPSTITYTTNY